MPASRRPVGDRRSSALNPGGGCPSLAEYYRDGLRIVVEPGSAFAYSNHGYATPERGRRGCGRHPARAVVFGERIFEPLGMADSDLVRSDRIARAWRRATRWEAEVRRQSPIVTGPGRRRRTYSTTRDHAKVRLAALLGVAGNQHGRVLESATLASMFQPHYRPDERMPGMGLGFFLAQAGGHRFVLHDGILPGFNSELLVAPDDGIGVIGLTNGSSGGLCVAIDRAQAVAPRRAGPAGGGPAKATSRTTLRSGASSVAGTVFPPRISDLRQRLMLGFWG